MFVAFGVIAAVTITTSVIAWIAYERLGNSVQNIASRDIVAVSLAAELTEKGGVISATAPSLVAAQSDTRRKNEFELLNRTLHEMETLVDRVHSGESEKQDRAAKKKLLSEVATNMWELDELVRRRIWLAGRNQEFSDKLRWAHADLLDEVEPMITDARFIIGLSLERENSKSTDGGLEQKIAQQEALLNIKSTGNLLVGLISRAATMNDTKSLEDTRNFALEIAAPVEDNFAPLKKIGGTLSLRQSFNSVVSYISSENSLFDLRRDELELKKRGEQLLAGNRNLVQTLQKEIASQVQKVNKQAQMSAAESAVILSRTKSVFAAAAIGSIVISVLIVWLYVGRNLVGRITALDVSMRQIASGDLEADVPSEGSDEIADMATALRTFRDTLTETQAELVQAGKLAALGQLSAGIAHELNQPLAAIQSRAHSAGVLLKRRDQGAVQENLNSISSLANRMASKINHLKTLARKPSRDISVVGLESTVAGALDILHARIRDEDITVVNRLTGNSISVSGGAIRLEQVMLNILGNAFDAMKNSTKRQLTISAEENADDVVVQISDTGPGVDRAIAGQIFDPFFTTKEVGEGLGLGLSISFNIIKDLGGSIRHVTVPGKGTTFYISLNRATEKVPA